MKRTNSITTWISRGAWVILLMGLLPGACRFVKSGGGIDSNGGGGSTPPLDPCITEDGITAIGDENELRAMVNNPSANYCLEEDIALTEDWDPIDMFTGTLDGKGHTIKGLTINEAAANTTVGFFRELGAGAVVKNLSFNQAVVEGQGDTGVLAGKSSATALIENLQIIGASVESYTDAGGLVVHNSGSIKNSYTMATLSGSTVGGLAAYNSGTIESSYARGAVKNSVGYAGGLVASNTGTIKNSYASGAVGDSNSRGSRSGGLVGVNQGAIESSYASGVISGIATVGGLVGQNIGAITNSYATGAVGGSIVGGLVGVHQGTIKNSYARGAVSGGTGDAGGLVGHSISGTIENSHFDIASTTQINGIGDDANAQAGNAQGSTGAPDKSAFVGWDFASTWTFVASEWPTLAWQ